MKRIIFCLSVLGLILFLFCIAGFSDDISEDLNRIRIIEQILRQTEANIVEAKSLSMTLNQEQEIIPIMKRKAHTFKPDINIHSFLTFDTERDNPFESQAMHFLEANVSFKDQLTEKASYFFSFTNDFSYNNGNGSQADIDIALDQFYFTYRQDNYEISVGKQEFTWGKLDEFFILDILNPQDFRRFFFLSKNDRKIPLWALSYIYHTSWENMASFQFIFIPQTKPNRWHYFGHDYALFDHLKQGVIQNLPIHLCHTIDSINISESKTGFTLDNSDLLVKASYTLEYFDLDLIYMYKLDNQAILFPRSPKGNLVLDMLYNPSDTTIYNLLASNPVLNDLTIDEKRNRLNLFGISAEGTIWDMGFRYEWALILDKYWISEKGIPIKRNALVHGIGLDNQRTDFYYNIQLLHQRVFDYTGLYKQGRDTFSISTEAYWQSKYNRWKFGISCAINLEYDDWFLNPYITYSNLTGLKHTLGLYLLNGPPGTVFGTFRGKDVVYLETELDF